MEITIKFSSGEEFNQFIEASGFMSGVLHRLPIIETATGLMQEIDAYKDRKQPLTPTPAPAPASKDAQPAPTLRGTCVSLPKLARKDAHPAPIPRAVKPKVKWIPEPRKCEWCGRTFTATSDAKTTCSSKCYKAVYNRNYNRMLKQKRNAELEGKPFTETEVKQLLKKCKQYTPKEVERPTIYRENM